MEKATRSQPEMQQPAPWSVLEELARKGAQQMLAAALETEVAEFVEKHEGRIDEDGRRVVVRNGYMPERELVTGIGPITVAQPRVDDRELEQECRFTSGILPRYMRRVPSVDNGCFRGVRNFEHRYGFKTRPDLLRFRALDPTLAVSGFSDVSVPLQEFARWSAPEVRRVFVLENDVTGLAFPDCPASIVVFGRGYSSILLRDVRWLDGVELVYWGDIDTHGFAILDRFRQLFPHTRSILMDRRTLFDHRAQWGVESKPTAISLEHLTESEGRLYEELSGGSIRPGLRLEQELISFSAVRRAVAGM